MLAAGEVDVGPAVPSQSNTATPPPVRYSGRRRTCARCRRRRSPRRSAARRRRTRDDSRCQGDRAGRPGGDQDDGDAERRSSACGGSCRHDRRRLSPNMGGDGNRGPPTAPRTGPGRPGDAVRPRPRTAPRSPAGWRRRPRAGPAAGRRRGSPSANRSASHGVRVGRLERQRLGRRARRADRRRPSTKTRVGRSGGMLNGISIEIRPSVP